MFSYNSNFRRGLTLIEVMVAMALLTGLAGAVLMAVLQVRKIAEDDLYQATASTIAAGYLEQMLGMSYPSLREIAVDNSKPIPTRIDQGKIDNIFINQWTKLDIPIISESKDDGTLVPRVSMKYEVQAHLRDLRPDGVDAVEVGVTYAWISPSNQQRYERTIKTIRCSIR